MAYVTVDKDGKENIFSDKPTRYTEEWDYPWVEDIEKVGIPQGSIEKLIGHKLSWQDEPVELKGEDSEL